MTDRSDPVLQQIAHDKNGHFARLREEYRAVGDRTWLSEDFTENNLENSRNLFTPESLQARKPQPRALEVYALLSGLPFAEDFTDRLVAVQMRISEILGERLHYWVIPQNLGVEYCVFKWPTEPWDEQWYDAIKNTLNSIPTQAFCFHINGVQINPDGCVVARGFDENAEMFRVRALLRAGVRCLPEKQSRWAHVPLGRILEPLGTERFARLGGLIGEMVDQPIASTNINVMKFIHETRWYMEERETVAEYPLGNAIEEEAI